MKYFTAPNGIFALKIPNDWQYQNLIFDNEEVNPFSFQPHHDPIGCFQISCYPLDETKGKPKIEIQKPDTGDLHFEKARMDGGGFNVHLWYAVVEGYSFMAKYIYETNKESDSSVSTELTKAEVSLSTLELISESNRSLALEYDKYEKFNASLAASFDLKYKAIESKSLIELIIIIANQIDAYLRIALVMKKQLKENSRRIDSKLLFQDEGDTPIMERTIYKLAVGSEIIDNITYEKLEELYKERNKVVHRYIISDFKTRFLLKIVMGYEEVCETVRQSLKAVEDLQFKLQIGIHGNGRNPDEEPTQANIFMLYSQVNDKHLLKEMCREIDMATQDDQ